MVSTLQIEKEIDQLPRAEQLRLLDCLVARLKISSTNGSALSDVEMAAMAADPDIQREIALINAEFAVTEMDGLDLNQ